MILVFVVIIFTPFLSGLHGRDDRRIATRKVLIYRIESPSPAVPLGSTLAHSVSPEWHISSRMNPWLAGWLPSHCTDDDDVMPISGT